MSLPPVAPIAQGGSHGITMIVAVLPPLRTVREPHDAVPDDGLSGSLHPAKLLSETPRSRMVVIVPRRDDLTLGVFASEISFLSNVVTALDMNEPYPIIVGQQIAHVFAVRDYQQFSIWIGLILEAPYRFRQPLAPAPRDAETRHEREAAGSPRELPRRASALAR